MSHFAEIKDGIVQRVLSVEKEYVDSGRHCNYQVRHTITGAHK